MRKFWKKPELPEHGDTEEKERRLDDAERRVSALESHTEWLRRVVATRDAKNHWQESVNQLFLGGQP